MASKDLVFRFLGVDGGAGREFDKMAGKSATLEKALTKVGIGMAGLGVALGVESVRAAAKFQQSMELIHTQAGRSQAAVNQMSKAVLQLAGPTATAPDELSKGLYHLASTGLSTAKSLQALRIAAEGAKMGGADLESVTNALNATIASGIKGSGDFAKAMGALNAVVGSGDMRMQDLAEAMGTGVLAAVKGFGLSLNDVGAALATFGDNNIRGADAATQLRMAVLFMAKPAAGAKDALKSLGLTSHTLANDMGKGGLGLALTDLHNRLIKAGDTGSKMGDVLLNIFGHKAGTGLSILEQQFSRFQSKQEEVAKGSKNFASDWGAYTQTFGYSWDRARAAFESMTIQLGTKLLPTATKAMNWIGTTGVADLEKFSGWVSDNKRPIEDVAKALAAIAAFRFAAGTLSKINGVLGGGKGVTSALGVASKASPVPVFVTNPGFGPKGGPGIPIPGTAEHGKPSVPVPSTTALGDIKNGFRLARGGQLGEGLRLGAQGLARSPIDPMAALAFVLLNPNDKSYPHILNNNYQQRLGHSTVGQQRVAGQTLTRLQHPANFPGTDDVTAAKTILQYGSKDQIAQLGKLAQKDKDIAAALQAIALGEKSATKGAKDFSGESGKSTKDAIAYAHQLAAAQAAATRSVIAETKKIPGAWAALKSQAKSDGLSIGQELAAGFTVGIKQGNSKVQFVAKQVVDGVVHISKTTGQITSPSKRTIYLGRMLAEGLGVGMGRGATVAVTKAQDLMNAVLSKLDTAKGNASGLASGVSGNLTGGASLANMPLASLTSAFGTSYTASPTVAGISSYLSGYLSRERAFSRNLGVARKKGLSAAEAANIAQLGLDSGGPIAAALASGSRSQVHQIAALQAGITSTSNSLGNTLAQGVYGAEIKKQTQLLAEIKDLLAHAPKATGHAVGSALKSPHAAKTLATSHTRAQRSK